MTAALKAVEDFLFRDFLSRTRFTTNYYDMDSQQRTSEALDKRFKGYQKLCLYGLGSVFWGATTGVLSNLQDKHPDWIFWGSIYFVLSLVLMLNGLTAATFSSSTPLALSTAGLGAWTAYIYMLATFHVASLQFHSNVEQCAYSMIIASIAVTFHWSYSSQDPLVLLMLCKLILWLLLITLYGIVILIPWGIFKLFSLVPWTIGLVIRWKFTKEFSVGKEECSQHYNRE
ncbi:unnamed protein product [Miscanthus lutarioriparius]|uniref:Uncharacterized protein n=1 Tax=Miscanthus lutarioriparius TaxID=422564 RepID=A0A811QNL0_9POAL|nr:unnamed protein product [Miscanthus lutarioriparius]